MSESSIAGSCLCKSVTFEATPPFRRMVHCHCSRCRKGSGTGHATNLTMDPGQLRWLSGEEAISKYDLPEARSFGKWFCSRCGSPVPRLTRNGKMMVVPAGSLDSVPPMKPTDHIFWGSRAAWACESSGLPTHTEYPPAWQCRAEASKYGVNLGCLEGVSEEELSKIPITYIDGMNDRFEAPQFCSHL